MPAVSEVPQPASRKYNQCKNVPPGASGSDSIKTYRSVPAGGFVHLRGTDSLSPKHVNRSGMSLPSLKAELTRVNGPEGSAGGPRLQIGLSSLSWEVSALIVARYFLIVADVFLLFLPLFAVRSFLLVALSWSAKATKDPWCMVPGIHCSVPLLFTRPHVTDPV
jgi:hypothetical protein